MKPTFMLIPAILAISIWNCTTDQVSTEEKPPNILFAIADDVSYPHMAAYGCSWVHTPAFDRIAREGVLFENAFTPNAKCAPSRAIILTGRNSWQLEAAANHYPYFPKKFKTVFEALKEHGYFTGHVAKGYAPGDPGKIDGKTRELVGPAFNTHKTTPPTEFIGNNDYAANFEAFLEERDRSQPFCFWYGSIEPHRAYSFGTGASIGGKSLADVEGDILGYYPDVDSVRHDFLDYAFELEYFDQHLERMLTILEESGELENTIIIVTADNGMPFPRIKGQVYEQSNHLPLAIRWGNGIKSPGRTIQDFVTFADFTPTILELAGISFEMSGMQPFEGKSIRPLLNEIATEPHRDFVLIGKERHDIGRPNDWGYPVRGIRTKDYLYIMNLKPERWPSGNPETGYLNCDGSPTKTVILHQNRHQNDDTFWKFSFGKRPEEELYFLPDDPMCIQNLARDEGQESIKAALKQLLLSELERQKDPRVLGNGDVFDEYVYSNAKHRNFYSRFMEGSLTVDSAGWVNPDDFELKPLE